MPADLIALLEKGYAHQQGGNFALARKNYLEVLRRDPKNEFALNLMGVVCIRESRFGEARTYLETALSVNASDAETHDNFGLACKELHDFATAKEAFVQSLLLNPAQPVTLNNLGNVFAAVDEHSDAIPRFEMALKIDESYVDCMLNLAISLREVGRLDDALAVCDRAISFNRRQSRSNNIRGEVLLGSTRYDEARDAFERAVAIDDSVVARINLSTALKQLGHAQQAVEVLRGVLEEEEDNTEAHNHLGVLYEQLGETGKAAEHFRLALKFTPNHASSFFQLSKLKDQRLTDKEIDKIESQLRDPKTLDIFRSSLYFALAWEYEKREDFTASIDYFIKAQAIKAVRSPYDRAATDKYREVCKNVFPVSLDFPIEIDDALPVPVFVIGMPRSGTTLTEQIIASHSQITGAGEIGFINNIVEEASAMTKKPFPFSIRNLTADHVDRLRKSYLTRLIERFGNSPYIVDKNPLNYNFAGVIATLFPEARMLYCKRNPLDNCVSIFRLPFDENQGYSHDLAALGDHYRRHELLMAYWSQCFPTQILTVEYEETVDDLESQARRILEFIGVEFEDQVLNFFENQRIVMTPSAEQVRQPIYRSSINAWQRYGDALGPLIEALTIAQ